MNVVHLVGNGFDIKAGLRTDAKTLIAEIVKNNKDKDIPEYARNLLNTISSEGIETWADFESKLGEYSNNALVNNDPSQYIKAKSFFDGCLIEALERRELLVSDSFISSNFQACIASLAKTIDVLQIGESTSILDTCSKHNVNMDSFNHELLSFNYTHTLEAMIHSYKESGSNLNRHQSGSLQILGNVHHVHGDISNVLICGVDNPEQIANQKFRDDPDVINSFVKEKEQLAIGATEFQRGQKLIENADIIVVFGMSFGKTDYRWWNAILNGMKKNQVKALIILDHDPDSKYKIVGERLQAISAAKNRFLNAANCQSDWERKDLEKKIFVAPANAIFPFINPLREKASETGVIRIGYCQ